MIYGNALMPGGSGKAGATLTVSAPLGSVITISKDGESYSSSLLPAVFKGLSSGTWTRTATLNGQTSEKFIQIVADYVDTVEYFAATINVTFPAGSIVECRQGDYVIATTNTSGQHSFHVPYPGTWTVSCTDGTDTAETSVEITENGQTVSIALSYQLVLLDGANTFDDVTGGWSGYSSLDENGLYVQGQTGSALASTKTARTANTFERGSYTVLKAIVSDADDVGWGNYEDRVYSQISFGEAAVIVPETNDEQTVTLELGSVQSGQVAITATGGYYDAVNMYAKIRVKKLWLE